MAEPLGIASSVISILDLSVKIIKYAQAVKGASEDRQKLAGELELLNHVFQQLKSEEPHLSETTKRALQEPIKNLISLLDELAKKLQSGQSSSWSWPFKRGEFDEKLADIERYKSSILVLITLEIKQGNKALQQMLVDIKSDFQTLAANEPIFPLPVEKDERTEVLRWLSPLNFYAKQADTLAKRAENTGNWLLDDVRFKHWYEGRNTSLVCPGIPGAGKSVLASVVVHHLQQTFREGTDQICYIYCNYKEQVEQTTINLVSSLLRQFAVDSKLEQVTRGIMEFYRGFKGKDCRPSLADYSNLLQQLIPSYKRLFIVIDALDECNSAERKEFIAELGKFSANVMITTRHIPDILESFPEASRLEVRANEKDIKEYLIHEISSDTSFKRLTDRDSSLVADVVQGITQRTEGMFLLAKLHFKAVSRHSTINAVREELQTLPKDDTETYDKAIQLILAQKAEWLDIAKKVLTWITYATRPMSLLELQHMLATKADKVDLSDGAMVLKETILSVCLGLVVFEEESAKLRLVHYTTQEYLSDKGRVIFGVTPHAELAICCINHIINNDVFLTDGEGEWPPSRVEGRRWLRNFSFWIYVSRNWVSHIRNHDAYESAHESSTELTISIDNFLQQKDKIIRALHFVWSSQAVTDDWSFPDYGEWPMARPIEENFWSAPLVVRAACGLRHSLQLQISNSPGFKHRKIRRGVGDKVVSISLIWAAASGYTDIVRLLLEWMGVDIPCDVFDSDSQGNFDEATRLVLPGLKQKIGQFYREKLSLVSGRVRHILNTKIYGGRTALHWSAQGGHCDITCLILQIGANCNLQDDYGTSPLHMASERGHTEIVKLLLQAGANCNLQNKRGDSPLKRASLGCHSEIVKMLLQAGANCNLQGKNGNSPLHCASEYNYPEIVTLLLQAGANCNLQGKNGNSPLHCASEYNYPEIVTLLLQTGANCNLPNDYGASPLHMASERGLSEIVKLLLQAGANCNLPNDYGKSPLHMASQRGHSEIVKLLLQAGANCNLQNKKGPTPLHMASHGGHSEIVKLLLQAGANCNLQGYERNSPLHYASEYNYPEIVKLLLQAGANCNTQNDAGNSPIHLAVMIRPWCESQFNGSRARVEIVVLLLEHGANPLIKNTKGQTPRDVVYNTDVREQIVEILLDRERQIHVQETTG